MTEPKVLIDADAAIAELAAMRFVITNAAKAPKSVAFNAVIDSCIGKIEALRAQARRSETQEPPEAEVPADAR